MDCNSEECYYVLIYEIFTPEKFPPTLQIQIIIKMQNYTLRKIQELV